MVFEVTEEQVALRTAVRGLLAERSDEQQVRRTAAGELGVDPRLWAVLAEQLGATGLVVPERFGGFRGRAGGTRRGAGGIGPRAVLRPLPG